jgi:hypothetical protein
MPLPPYSNRAICAKRRAAYALIGCTATDQSTITHIPSNRPKRSCFVELDVIHPPSTTVTLR